VLGEGGVKAGASFCVERIAVGDKALVDELVNLLGRCAVFPRRENRKPDDVAVTERVALTKFALVQKENCCYNTSVTAAVSRTWGKP